MPHLVDHRVEQLAIVADHHDAALVGAQEIAEPVDGVGVEVVGRLVQEKRLGVAEQDPGQLHPAPLAAGQRAQRLAEHPVGKPQVGTDPGRFALGGVPAECGERLLQPAVPADHLVPLGLIDHLAHRDLGLGELVQQDVDAAGGQHPVAGGDVEVAGARVLRQVADLTAALDGAGVRRGFTGEHAQAGRLAGAIAPDQADPVAGLYAQGGAVEQDARAGTQFQRSGGDHKNSVRGCGQRPSPAAHGGYGAGISSFGSRKSG